MKIIGVLLSGMVLVSSAYGFNLNSNNDGYPSGSDVGQTRQLLSQKQVDQAINQLKTIGIKDKADQQLWSGFVDNCIKQHVSAKDLSKLATSGVAGVNKFLSGYTAPKQVMTHVYGKVKSCPQALPIAKRIVAKVAEKSSKHSGWL